MMDLKTPESQLYHYLKARRPIVYIHHFDFAVVDKMIEVIGKKALGGRACTIEEFSEANGRVIFSTKDAKGSCQVSLPEFLSRFNSSLLNNDRTNYLVVLKEVHAKLSDPCVISLLQTIAQRTRKAIGEEANRYRVQVVIADSQRFNSPELEKLVTVIEVRPPDDKRIGEIVDEVVRAGDVKMEDSFRPELILSLKGLSELEIQQILAMAAESRILDKEALELIHAEKRQMIQKSGLLELIESKAGERPVVGGLKNLNEFINNNIDIFKRPGFAKSCGVDAPAGVMIVGMPGCGKSLMAKTIAHRFNVPLLKLDVGRLMGKYVGESENNLHRAIAIAESAAPCVLWIDEIEKAFSGIGSDGGSGSSMTRMFGIFLTWMQEKNACVYVVATANNIDKLPPEFLRRGRFDEIFYVGYPNFEERKEILELHIKRRGGNTGIAIDEVAKRMRDEDNYSGADIESIVKESMRRLFVKNMKNYGETDRSQWEPLSADILKTVMNEMKSSYHSQKDKLDKMLEKLKSMDAKSAS